MDSLLKKPVTLQNVNILTSPPQITPASAGTVLLPTPTYYNGTTRIYALAGEAGAISSFNELSASTITVSSLVANHVSSILIDTNEVNASTLFAYELFIDNQGLTATPTELLLNGIPLATTSNLSSLTDWALDPAISTVNLNNNALINGTFLQASAGYFNQLYTSSLVASNVTANELVALSTIQTFNYLSSHNIVTDTLTASSINGYNVGDFLSSSAIPNAISISSMNLSTLTLNVGKQSTVTMIGDASYPTIPPVFNITAPYSVNLNMGTQNVDNDFTQAGQFSVKGNLYVADPAQPAFGARFQGASDTSYNFNITTTKNLIFTPNNPNSAFIIDTVNNPGQNKGLTLSNTEISPSNAYGQDIWVAPGPILQTNGGFNVGNNLLAGSNVQVSTINGYTVSDFLSTSASQYDPNPVFSTVTVSSFVAADYVSATELFVSSINGAEFSGAAGGGIQVSTLVTNNISSVFGDFQVQLVSTLGFSLGSNSFSLGGVNLGLGNILGQITGGALGIIGAATGTVALGTGVAALLQTRGTKNINTSNYETINGTTQLQVSTIGDYVSSVYRFSSGNPADQEVGEEYFISTIFAPGSMLLRSFSDPLNTASTPTSTIQSFGPWVALPIAAMSSIADWSFEPALSNVNMNGYDVTNANALIGNSVVVSSVVGSVASASLDLADPSNLSFIHMDSSIININTVANSGDINLDAGTAVYIGKSGGASALVCDDNTLSTITFLPSTIIRGSPNFQQFEVLNRQNLSCAQACVNAVRFASNPDEPNSGFVSYSRSQDRLIALNSTQQIQYVAYLSDLSNATVLSSFTVLDASNFAANNISTGQALSLTGGAAIEFRVADGTNLNYGSLAVNQFGMMTLTADAPNSEVSVPVVNADRIGIKSGSYLEIQGDVVIDPFYSLSTQTLVADDANIKNTLNATTLNTTTLNASTINVSTTGIISIGSTQLYEPAVGSLTLTNGAGASININAGVNMTFNEPGAGGQMTFGNNILEVNQVNTTNLYSALLVSSKTATVSSISILGLSNSTITIGTASSAGTVGQPAGRLLIQGQDVDLGQSDLWCQQIRLGANNPTNAQTEIAFYDANGAFKGFNTALLDRTIRVVSTINGTTGGYLLDTNINPPFFSTIGTNLALMAFFPSTVNNTIGIQTISQTPVATSAFTSNVLASALTTAPQVVASTVITTSLVSSYILCQANTSASNITNQYHDMYINLQIDNTLSPSTFTSLPAGIGHYANGSISFRTYVGPGTHTLTTYMSCDANTTGVLTQVDMWATGNLQ